MSEDPVATEQRCPNCHMAQSEWEHNGQGYSVGGQTYCCRGCAEATGCTCHQTMA
jgi:hypothetical protein